MHAKTRQVRKRTMATATTAIVLGCGAAMQGGASPAHATTPADSTSYVNIVAHEDDDVLFLNPDLAAPLRAGHPNVTIILTSGEANGSAFTTPPTSAADFAAQREDGSRAAYAKMMGLADNWTQQDVVRPTGADYEMDTLVGAPQVKLVFLNIKDGGDPNDPDNLTKLNSGTVSSISTFVPDNPIVTPTPQVYTKQSLISTLDDLLNQFQPTVVRTQQPSDIYNYAADNVDHIAAGSFTDQAVASYHGPGGDRHVILEHFRDYANNNMPDNLSLTQRNDKETIFQTYEAHDANAYHYDTDSPDPDYAAWPKRQYQRWPAGSSWTATDADGRIEAFAVEDGTVMRWYQTTPGGSWTGPEALAAPSGELAPQLSIARNSDGRLQVFAMQYDSVAHTSNVVTAAQTTAGSSFGGWTNLGNPNGTGDQTGLPAVGVNANGDLQVFAKNYYGGVSTLIQSTPGGSFGAWTDLGGGGGVQDGLSVASDSAGRLQLFAKRCDIPVTQDWGYQTVQCWLAHWSQSTANGTGAWDTTEWDKGKISDQPTIGTNQDGRLQVFFRQAGGSDVETVAQQADGTWNMTPVDFSGNGGSGSVAVAANTGTDGRIFVFERDNASGVSVTEQTAANGTVNNLWTAFGGPTEDLPAAAVDADGKVVLTALGTDGRLDIQTQQAAGSALSFSGWQPVGS
ncbi:LmbE family N-acetylglucosaminyl deacetylase [Catenulispora sp. MAP12-49]|uniref:PIG-L family deacetylase n=1 Tax=unclassified Catenulispora TaxID=414885 RepID=UPI003519BC64